MTACALTKTITYSMIIISSWSLACAADTPPEDAEKIIPWLSKRWVGDGWGADGSKNYMRPLGDEGWKARMLALQAVAKAGDKAVPSLVATLDGKDSATEMRIFAAQALGFVAAKSAKDSLLAALSSDPSDAVRLYAADAIGMNGLGVALKAELEKLRGEERNHDVKKHIGYVLGRGANGISEATIKRLAGLDPGRIDSAKVGGPAPDFELPIIGGKKISLGEFKGKSAVVIVFLYGDT